MKIIITEDKSNTISDKLKSMVKQYGLIKSSKSVGGPKNLAKLGFNNDPMEFLNLFNDLNIVQSEEDHSLTLFRYEKGINMMIYDKENRGVENRGVYVNYDDIWLFLRGGFGLNYEEIQEVIKDWLDEVYNLSGVTPYITGRKGNWRWMRSII
jgi:hypothetical protein